MLIFKIVAQADWAVAESAGHFDGAGVDRTDGYIHFSTGTQVRETASKHFAGRKDLLLIAVESERLGAALRWEPSRGGALFPHLYRSLARSEVVGISRLPIDASGRHIFPPELVR
jgi:uncharacterized protein (DUF952 family)